MDELKLMTLDDIITKYGGSAIANSTYKIAEGCFIEYNNSMKHIENTLFSTGLRNNSFKEERIDSWLPIYKFIGMNLLDIPEANGFIFKFIHKGFELTIWYECN